MSEQRTTYLEKSLADMQVVIAYDDDDDDDHKEG
jgi:hypothetical protein